jgi:hypothetical protein
MDQPTYSKNLLMQILAGRSKNSLSLKPRRELAKISGLSAQNATDTSPVASEPLRVTTITGDFRVFPSFIVTLRQKIELKLQIKEEK